MIASSENNPKLWGPILEVVGLHWSPVVAGGCLRDSFLDVDAKDIDVFVPARFDEDLLTIVEKMSPEFSHGKIIYMNAEALTSSANIPEGQWDTLEQHWKTYNIGGLEDLTVHPVDEYSGDGFAPDLIGVWEGEILGAPTNIIGRCTLACGTVNDLINTLDFGILQQAYAASPQTGLDCRYNTPASIKDMQRHTCTLMHRMNYEQSYRRWNRFNNRNPFRLTLVDEWA